MATMQVHTGTAPRVSWSQGRGMRSPRTSQHAANDGLRPTVPTNPPYDSAYTTKESRSIALSLACFVTRNMPQCHLLPRDVHAQRYLIKSPSPITLPLSYTTPARTATRLALALRLGSDSSSKCSPISALTDANLPSANRAPLGMRRRLSSLLAPFSSKQCHTPCHRLYTHLQYMQYAIFLLCSLLYPPGYTDCSTTLPASRCRQTREC